MRALAAVLGLLCLAGPACAQEARSLDIPVALFVKERATGYGMYEARENNHFKVGEPLLFYIEPTGFRYEKDGELTRFGAVMDIKLTQEGRVLYSKDGFLRASFASHHANRELNYSGSLNVDGAPAGDYALELVLQDTKSTGIAKVVLPFVID